MIYSDCVEGSPLASWHSSHMAVFIMSTRVVVSSEQVQSHERSIYTSVMLVLATQHDHSKRYDLCAVMATNSGILDHHPDRQYDQYSIGVCKHPMLCVMLHGVNPRWSALGHTPKSLTLTHTTGESHVPVFGFTDLHHWVFWVSQHANDPLVGALRSSLTASHAASLQQLQPGSWSRVAPTLHQLFSSDVDARRAAAQDLALEVVQAGVYLTSEEGSHTGGCRCT